VPFQATTLKAGGPYGSQVPLDASNLILRAHALLQNLFDDPPLETVGFSLEKNLPIASGIGGGSSDAAAALTLLCRYWNIDLPNEDLAALALSLGADVPMCIAATPLIARGTGELLEPVKLPRLPMVLVNPGDQLATPAVFNALQHRDNESLSPLPE